MTSFLPATKDVTMTTVSGDDDWSNDLDGRQSIGSKSLGIAFGNFYGDGSWFNMACEEVGIGSDAGVSVDDITLLCAVETKQKAIG